MPLWPYQVAVMLLKANANPNAAGPTDEKEKTTGNTPLHGTHTSCQAIAIRIFVRM